MAKTAAFGAALKLGDGASPESFATVAHVASISFPGAKADDIDVTAHDSADAYEEFVKGVIRTGEVQCKVFWDSTESTHDASTGLFSVGPTDLVNWQIVFADSGDLQAAFAGYLGYNLEAAAEGANEMMISIRISGAITLT